MYGYENIGHVNRRPEIPRQRSSPDLVRRSSPFPVSQWFRKQLPYTVTVSFRILTGFPFAHPLGCNLNVITLAHIQFGYSFFTTNFTDCQE